MTERAAAFLSRQEEFSLDRVLVIGLGSIGRRHARVLRQLAPRITITAVRRKCDGDAVEGVDACVTSIEEALRCQPQAAVVATPAPTHMDAARVLSAAGVHLLVEKPMAASSDGVAPLIDSCKRAGVVLMVGYNLRFLPSLGRFAQLVHEDRVGSILSVRAEVGQNLATWRSGTDYRSTVSAKAELGGGVLLELSHEIDYLRWIFGEIETVSATLTNTGTLGVDVEDVAHLLLGIAPTSGNSPLGVSLSLDFVRHDRTRTCVAVGERGSLRWDGVAGTVDVFETAAAGWITDFTDATDREETYRAEWRHFMECISSGKTPQVTGADGLAAVRVVEAAKRSHETAGVVRIEPAGD